MPEEPPQLPKPDYQRGDVRLEVRPTRLVPCNGCTECCQGDLIFLHPECGDDPTRYLTDKEPNGSWTLRHKLNGDCIYLDRKKGCTIWERRPVVCRELDCLIFLDPMIRAMAFGHDLRKARRIIKAAKKRRKRNASAVDTERNPQ